jgi:asparagine synthase (glutamine-hydrolysing)
MVSAMRHRGPDAEGEHVDDHVALGSARLAIIDLQAGDQPIYNEDRSICTIYNGEIYNFPELQAELRGRGHALASRTDTEVLVHLYEDEGIGFIHRLNGMYAFALWIPARRTLHLVRDRFGIKPLYLHWDGTTLAFGSEVKSLVAAGAVKPELSLDAAVELLTFQNIHSERSLFEGVDMLPAGSVLTLSPHGMQIERYWDPRPDPDPGLNGPALANAIRERFDGAIERQLRSDVEIAAYLSGGLDTGAITASAAPRLERITTFCAGFDVSDVEGREREFDERSHAAELARLLGTHHHELWLRPADMEMVLPRLVRHLEEPRMSFSYPNFLTAGVTSRWTKVVLSGAGGDELFGGYPWRYEHASEPDWAERYFVYWSRLLPRAELGQALHPDVIAHVDLDRPRAVFDGILSASDGLAPLERMLYFEIRTFLHGLLVVEDKLSMAHSLESRVPFLDYALADFILTVPAEVKLRGRSKALFRQAMAPRLPEQVTERRKTGFVPPQEAWFRHQQREYLERMLLSDRSLERRVLRPEFVRAAVEEHVLGTRDRRLLLWTLLCLEWWHRIFIDGSHAQ